MSEIKIKYLAMDTANITNAQLSAICELIDCCNANYFSLPRVVQDRLEDALDAIKRPTHIKPPTAEEIAARAHSGRFNAVPNTGD